MAITSQKLGSHNFWRIGNTVLNNGKRFSKNSSLDGFGISLPVFPSRTNLKLHDNNVALKSVKEVIISVNFSEVFDPNCIPVVVLAKCEPELSYIQAEMSDMCLKESCFTDWWKILSVVPVFQNVGEKSLAKNYHLVCVLSVTRKIFEKLADNTLADRPYKCDFFTNSQHDSMFA